MNSLVDYGVSSDSEKEEDVNTDASCVSKDLGDQRAAIIKAPRNFLLESGSASESEDDDPVSSSHHQTLRFPAAQKLPLPPASTDVRCPTKLPPPSLSTCSSSSVFSNPFKVQADQKLSALQRHVPLTMQSKPSHIGGKRMCVSYRKDGRCRFGIKCKFAHDSDLQTPLGSGDPSAEETPEPAGSVGTKNKQQNSKDAESEAQKGKKRRVGLSNSLIPPKKALKQYATQRERERVSMS